MYQVSKGYDDMEMMRSLPVETQMRLFHSVTLGMAQQVNSCTVYATPLLPQPPTLSRWAWRSR